MQEVAADSLMSRLPRPIRWFFELIGMAAAIITLIGWATSTLSLIGKMAFWNAAWAAFRGWLIQFPDWISALANQLGEAVHWLVQRYQEFVYPIFSWLFGWLPFALPEWAFDTFFVVAFALLGYVRIWFIGRSISKAERA